MSRLCLVGFTCVNIITLAYCTCVITLSFVQMSKGETWSDNCANVTHPNHLKKSLGMAALAVIGLIGLFSRNKMLLRTYIGVIILVCLVLVASMQMGFYSMHTPEGRQVEYVNGDEYKLEHFSERAKRIYLKEENWNVSKKCLKKQALCKSYFDDKDNMSIYELRIRHRLQGCCKPPKQCGYRNINNTYWAIPEAGPKTKDNDCLLYKNGEELCYECDACKASFIAAQIGDRFQMTVATIFWFIFCVCALILACSTLETFENSQSDKEPAKLEPNVSPL